MFYIFWSINYFDSEDNYRTGWRNASDCQQQFHTDNHTQPTYETSLC